ncbi:MAG: orotate phosphoribosyltransferase [Bacteroidaceae bacterium]|nr:orotate phosphoribosyltransferase [Prevotellaceae bacterium]MDY3062483.1 orotate phosphoribosyltransferase [Bacteroidaceae bacterium]
MKNVETAFAEQLLEVKAIKLQPENPFTWASGWKSPFYCDNRKTLSYPSLRTFVKENLAEMIRTSFPEADAVAGVATGAIAQGALVSDVLGLPFCYVRSKAKDHGMGNLIEGTLPEGSKVVVVEDLISTGGSSLKAVEALRAAGFEVVGMVAAYTYGFPVAEEAFRAANVKLLTLTNYQAVVSVATQTGYITADQQPTLDQWRKDPANWRNDLK